MDDSKHLANEIPHTFTDHTNPSIHVPAEAGGYAKIEYDYPGYNATPDVDSEGRPGLRLSTPAQDRIMNTIKRIK